MRLKPNTQLQLCLISDLYSVGELIADFSLNSVCVLACVCVRTCACACACMCVCVCVCAWQAFDMQRDLQITPRRLEYTREKEGELFTSLMTIANRKQEEMKEMIVETLNSMKEQLLEDAANLEFTGQGLRRVHAFFFPNFAMLGGGADESNKRD